VIFALNNPIASIGQPTPPIPDNASVVNTLQEFGKCRAAWLADRGTSEAEGSLTHWLDCASGRAIDAVPSGAGWTINATGWDSASPRPQVVADGSHYLTVTDSTLLDRFDGDDQPLHCVVWWKPIDSSTTRCLWCFSTPANTGYFAHMRLNGSGGRLDRRGSADGSAVTLGAAITEAAVRQNRASVFDGVYGSLYQNGVLKGGPGDMHSASALAISELTIGAYRQSGSTSYYLTGGIAMFVIYSSLTDLAGALAFGNSLFPVT
jgi:hypothetical protein